MIHAPNCHGIDDSCEPVSGGDWLQPPAMFVADAVAELDTYHPWCQVAERALELAEANA